MGKYALHSCKYVQQQIFTWGSGGACIYTLATIWGINHYTAVDMYCTASDLYLGS
jgi:hypothetical protein